jgi:peptidoglycan L-alanyl-D-glutamate endopeptidase CwlK
MKFISWLNHLFGDSRNGPQPTSPNSFLQSKPSSTPDQSVIKNEARASEWQADPRSEKNLATLEPVTARLAREHLRRLHAAGLNFKITSARRTFAEQTALYDKGRTAKGPKVTNARAGYSWHNFGTAYDLTLFSGKNPVWESPKYARAGEIGEELGLEWGGRWKKLVDRPHFQRRMTLTLAEARSKWPSGMVTQTAVA